RRASPRGRQLPAPERSRWHLERHRAMDRPPGGDRPRQCRQCRFHQRQRDPVSARQLRWHPDARTAFGGALIAPGNLTLQAAVIYPATNTQFLLMSTGTLASDSTLTIKPNGAATAPLSAGGGIVLDALTIKQDGTLWAPLGSIILGLQSTSQIPTAVSQVVN